MRILKKNSDGKSRAVILFYVNFLSSLVPFFQRWDLQVSIQSSSSLKLWHIDCYLLEMINSKDFWSNLNIQLDIGKNHFFGFMIWTYYCGLKSQKLFEPFWFLKSKFFAISDSNFIILGQHFVWFFLIWSCDDNHETDVSSEFLKIGSVPLANRTFVRETRPETWLSQSRVGGQ